MRRYLFLIICLLFPSLMMGQQGKSVERPEWADWPSEDLRNSRVSVFSATGYSEENAYEKAINKVVEERSFETGQRFTLKRTGENSYVIEGKDDLTVKFIIRQRADEFLPSQEFKVWLLVQMAKHPDAVFESVEVSNRYPFSARAFVPGMAQLYKGSTLKGSLFIAGEIAAVGGIVASECLRSSYESKINQTHNAAARKDYINKTDNMRNIRNGFIVGAAAIYVWNIIDGAVAKGKLHVNVGKSVAGIVPFATTESMGISWCMRF